MFPTTTGTLTTAEAVRQKLERQQQYAGRESA